MNASQKAEDGLWVDAWPEGVLARFLTVAGATVDLTYETATGTIVASCTGELCGWSERTDTQGLCTDTPEQERERFEYWLPVTKKRARTHAERCRLLPRPGGAA
ncbi:hypothetical protein [Streptomyces violascens]|uniref:Uncharacterized protein n=1 Tax=Streptomyces violascens TaxID=67381 RepID=A0ABQ3QPY5_9ACTN|nr:hypothetical protein [Streptomyces violascens]GGU24056.1 hypothetical protein GCM10010289_52030 [Streptomyces violascens]GHI39327.1 hypothetical protein Sviol_37350 [Streptomyces violascens]